MREKSVKTQMINISLYNKKVKKSVKTQMIVFSLYINIKLKNNIFTRFVVTFADIYI